MAKGMQRVGFLAAVADGAQERKRGLELLDGLTKRVGRRSLQQSHAFERTPSARRCAVSSCGVGARNSSIRTS